LERLHQRSHKRMGMNLGLNVYGLLSLVPPIKAFDDRRPSEARVVA
jgi:hypothetical protein